MPITITKLYLYPIKSCRGIPVSSAQIAPLGFKYDRNYMLVEVKPPKADDKDGKEKWDSMTIRQHPRMILIDTAIEAENLVISAPGAGSITVPLEPDAQFLSQLLLTPSVDLFGTIIRPFILPEESKFFATFLNVPTAKFVYLGPDPRPIIINQPPPSAQNGALIATAFADAAPYLLASEESFEDVNERLEEKLEIVRFRPNIVVKGVEKAWDEDDWKEIEVGDAGVFHVVARCPRCQLPNVDIATGVKNPNQPYKTLTKFRRIDKGAKYHPCFGMYCVSDKPDGTIKVGDTIEVLEKGEHAFIGF